MKWKIPDLIISCDGMGCHVTLDDTQPSRETVGTIANSQLRYVYDSPYKHKMTHLWFKAGTTSTTLAQLWTKDVHVYLQIYLIVRQVYFLYVFWPCYTVYVLVVVSLSEIVHTFLVWIQVNNSPVRLSSLPHVNPCAAGAHTCIVFIHISAQMKCYWSL